MGWIQVDVHTMGLVWLIVLIIMCFGLALIDTTPTIAKKKCRGCYGCRDACGRED